VHTETSLLVCSKKAIVTSVTDDTVKDRDTLLDEVVADTVSVLLRSYPYKHIHRLLVRTWNYHLTNIIDYI